MSQPKKNHAYTFTIALVDQAARPSFKSSPTLAAGDFKVDIDGGGVNNLATTPTASGYIVTIALSAGEMNGDVITVIGHDVAGAEWDDVFFSIPTTVYLNETELVQGVWDALTSALTTTGSIGKRLADDIDAQISTRAVPGSNMNVVSYSAGMSPAEQVLSTSNRIFADANNDVRVGSYATGESPAEQVLINPAQPLNTNASGDVTVAAYEAGQSPAEQVLLNPAQPLNTNANGNVTVADYETGKSPGEEVLIDPANKLFTNAGGEVHTAPDNQVLQADIILNRDMSQGENGNNRTVRQALRFLRNKWIIRGEKLSVYKEDDSTVSWDATIEVDDTARPITSTDPS